LLDRMVVLFLVFWMLSLLLSIVVVLIYPVESVSFPLVLASICYFFDRGEVKSQCHFNLHFLYSQRCWTFLQMLIVHLYFFLENRLFSSFACFFFSGLIFERLVFWVPCIFWLLIFCQIFSHSSLVTVCFAEVFSFMSHVCLYFLIIAELLEFYS
jgi:hypothetical protein